MFHLQLLVLKLSLVLKLPVADVLTFDGPPVVPVAELRVALYFLGCVPPACLITNDQPRKRQLALRFLSLLSKNFPVSYCLRMAIYPGRLPSLICVFLIPNYPLVLQQRFAHQYARVAISGK